MTNRLRLAVPNKGRLVEPTLALLHDAGLVFEDHERSLVARVQNFDLDILFVRTNDVIEFVGDGVADLGITGVDLLTETGAELPRIRSLGYGRCRLAAAVPADTPYQSVADLAGLRVATAHPNTARRFFAEKAIPIDVIPISGAVEVAPRLGLAREREPEPPLRFAQLVGLLFAVVGAAGYLLGAPLLGAVATGFALVAALLNAATGFCLGCGMYLTIRRVLPART